MAVSSTNSASVVADGSSDWIHLRDAKNVLAITADAWDAGATATLELSEDATDDTLTSGDYADGTAVVASGEGKRVSIDGPGYARITVAGYGTSDTIQIKRLSPS